MSPTYLVEYEGENNGYKYSNIQQHYRILKVEETVFEYD